VHRLGIAEHTIYDTQSGFQVRVTLVVLGSHDGVSTADRLEHCLVGFIPDALALDREVEESLGAEPGDNHGTSA